MPSTLRSSAWPLVIFIAIAVLCPHLTVDQVLAGDLAARYESLSSEGTVRATVERRDAVPRWMGGEGAMPDFRLPAGGMKSTWRGQLQVQYAGEYTFTAARRGDADVTMTVGGQSISLGTPVNLESGELELTIEARQAAAPWALELWWRGPGFADEPLDARFLLGPAEAVVSAATLTSEQIMRGAVLARTLGCQNCHLDESGLMPAVGDAMQWSAFLPGPRLDSVAARRSASVLASYHEDADQSDRNEGSLRAAIARYLTTRPAVAKAAPAAASPAATPAQLERGKTLFASYGCVACHGQPDASEARGVDERATVSPVPPVNAWAEWRLEGLIAFLKNPQESRPHGRMPQFGLSDDEAHDLAVYLQDASRRARKEAARAGAPGGTSDPQVDLRAAWKQLNPGNAPLPGATPAEQLEQVALRGLLTRGCLHCHDLDAGAVLQLERQPGRLTAILGGAANRMEIAAASWRTMALDRLQSGCLASSRPPQASAAMPSFTLTHAERQDLAVYVQAARAATSPSPAARLQVELAHFNCQRCHDNEGLGGESLARQLGELPEIHYYLPPTLTRAGERLQESALRTWIEKGAGDRRLRPWVKARMPGFGPAAKQIATLLMERDLMIPEGRRPSDDPPAEVQATRPQVWAAEVQQQTLRLGQFLAGSKGLACLNCHSMHGKLGQGQTDPTTRGPDLETTFAHLRPEYFQRWMMNPARVRPGTKMPQAIQPDGRVPLAQLAHLPPGTPLNALWTYLSLGDRAPLPVDEASELPQPVAGRNLVQRGQIDTHDAAAGREIHPTRGLALGFADGTLLYDADQLLPVSSWFDGFVVPRDQPYYGLFWDKGGNEAPDATWFVPHAIQLQAPGDAAFQSFEPPLESDPNTGTRFLGYVPGQQGIILFYELAFGAQRVRVAEQVRVEARGEGQGFTREFLVEGAPAGARVGLLFPVAEAGQRDEAGWSDVARAADIHAGSLHVFRAADRWHWAHGTGDGQPAWQGTQRGERPLARLVSGPADANGRVSLRVDCWRPRDTNPESLRPNALAELLREPSQLDPPQSVPFTRTDPSAPPSTVQPSTVQPSTVPRNTVVDRTPSPTANSTQDAADDPEFAGRMAIQSEAAPGYRMETIPAPFLGARPSDIAFDADGNLYVTAMTEGQVWRSQRPPTDRPEAVAWERFAEGLDHPIGLQILDGRRLFLAQKPEVTELIDRDQDGHADYYRTVASGWGLSHGWHEYTFGLGQDLGHNLWFTLNTGYFWTNPGYVNPGRFRGSILRIDHRSERLVEVAKGCRVPNGIALGPEGGLFFTDNQGDWIQSCKLAHIVPGRFYGHPETTTDALAADTYPDGRSSVWLPYDKSRSTSGPVLDDTQGGFGPFAGQMLLGDVGYGANPGILRVALEKVDGEFQGAVFRFIDNQPHGCVRMKFGPDDHLYAASLSSGLVRIQYQGQTPFAMHSMTIRPGGIGFQLHLTRPLASTDTPVASQFRFRRYHYLYTGNYGSPEAEITEVPATAAELSLDRRTITLSLPLETHPIGMVYELTASGLRGDDGQELQQNQAWYTVHRIPKP